MRTLSSLLMAVTLVASPAWARFGKRSTNSASAPSSSSNSSSSGDAAAPSAGAGILGGGFFLGQPRWYGGYYSGAFVPGCGYRCGWYAHDGTVPSEWGASEPEAEPSALRATIGVELMPYLFTERGFTANVHAALEGERVGFTLMGQNFAAEAKDGTGGVDLLQQVQAALTFAFFTGTHGRLRAVLGADVIFAADAIFFGPTGGLSGTLWLAGPVALEASALVTPYPFYQVDARAGVAVGLGALGVRAGWRVQMLDDRGRIDGNVNRDVFNGPYLGLSLAL